MDEKQEVIKVGSLFKSDRKSKRIPICFKLHQQLKAKFKVNAAL